MIASQAKELELQAKNAKLVAAVYEPRPKEIEWLLV